MSRLGALVPWLLLGLALLHLVDVAPRSPPPDLALVSVSSVDRTGLTISDRERGVPRIRRGRLLLPDLQAVAFETPPVDLAALETTVDVVPGSWVDLLIPSTEHGTTLLRISSEAQQSFVAALDDGSGPPSVETPLPIEPICLASPADISVEREAGSAESTLRVGPCDPVSLPLHLAGDGVAGLASGLGGLGVHRLVARAADGAVVTGFGQFSHRQRLAGAAAVAGPVWCVAVGIGLVRRRALGPARRRDPHTLRVVLVCTMLVAALFPFGSLAVPVLLVGAAWLLMLSPAGAAPAAPEKAASGAGSRWRRLVAAIAIATAPSLLLAITEPRPSEGEPEAVLAGRVPALHFERAPTGRLMGWAVEATVDAPDTGALAVLLGTAPLVEDMWLLPPYYPDLGAMLPGMVLDRRGDAVRWYLTLGDRILETGTTRSTRFSLAHRLGRVVLRDDQDHVLAARGQIPARGGGARVLAARGRPALRAEIRTPDRSALLELYASGGPTLALLAAIAWLAPRALVGSSIGRALVVRPLGVVLVTLLFCILKGDLRPLMVLWALLPPFIVFGAIAAGLVMAAQQRARPVRAVGIALACAAAPVLWLPLAARPAHVRFTEPWFAHIGSEDLLSWFDPQLRLFNDNRQTGRHRYRAIAPRSADAGGIRLVALGGSQTFGEGFEREQFSEIWTARLAASDPALEVVNLAVQGSTLSAQVERLERFLGSHGEVDGVIAVFGINDAWFLRNGHTRTRLLEAVVNGERSAASADPCAFIATCQVVRLAGSAGRLITGRGNGTREEHGATLADALRRLDDLTRRNGIELLLAREPQQCDLDPCVRGIDRYDYLHGFDLPLAADTLGSLSDLVKDGREPLADRRAALPFFDMVHLSESGHRVMAEAIADWRQQGTNAAASSQP